MRSNGSIIGEANLPTATRAKGVWNLQAQHLAMRGTDWPLIRQVVPVESGLARWFDASYGPTLYDATSGGSLVAYDGAVARWEDGSASPSHATQATPGRRPVRKQEVINGIDALLFDGSDDALELVANVSLVSGASIFIVGSQVTNTNGGMHRFQGTNGNVHHGYGSSSAFYDDFASTTLKAFTVTLTSPFCYSIVAGANWTAYMNGTQVRTVAHTLAEQYSGTPQQIGRSGFGAWNGYIGEVIVYNAALSGSDHNAVANYLMTKWGI